MDGPTSKVINATSQCSILWCICDTTHPFLAKMLGFLIQDLYIATTQNFHLFTRYLKVKCLQVEHFPDN